MLVFLACFTAPIAAYGFGPRERSLRWWALLPAVVLTMIFSAGALELMRRAYAGLDATLGLLANLPGGLMDGGLLSIPILLVLGPFVLIGAFTLSLVTATLVVGALLRLPLFGRPARPARRPSDITL